MVAFTLGRQTPLGATMFDATQTKCGACFWQGDGSARCLHRRCSGRRVVGISESPLFHAGSLATDLLYAESCAASAALNSVPESQLASAPELFSIDRDNQVIDSCPGVVQPPAATTQCCVTTPAPARHSLVIHLLACVWLIVQWNVVPDCISSMDSNCVLSLSPVATAACICRSAMSIMLIQIRLGVCSMLLSPKR